MIAKRNLNFDYVLPSGQVHPEAFRDTFPVKKH
jgi:hypothetical protein